MTRSIRINYMLVTTMIVYGLVCGCVSHDSGRARYGDPDVIVAGVPDGPTMGSQRVEAY